MTDTKILPRSTKVRDAKRSRAAILQAALDEFAEKGFHGASIRGIAARIDLSHAMLRYHFESKEKLWIAAVDFLFERAIVEISMSESDLALLAAGDLDIYRRFLRRLVAYSAKYPEHPRIVIQESILKSSRLDYYTSTYVRKYLENFEILVDVLKKLEVLPPRTLSISYYYMLAGAINNIFTMVEEAKIAFGRSPMEPDIIASHSDAIVAIFCPNR